MNTFKKKTKSGNRRSNYPFILVPNLSSLKMRLNIEGIPDHIQIGTQEWFYTLDLFRTYGASEAIERFMTATKNVLKSVKMNMDESESLELTLAKMPNPANEYARWKTANERFIDHIRQKHPEAFTLTNPVAFAFNKPAQCGDPSKPIDIDGYLFDLSNSMPRPVDVEDSITGAKSLQCRTEPDSQLLPNTSNGMAVASKHGALECCMVSINDYKILSQVMSNDQNDTILDNRERPRKLLSGNCDGNSYYGYNADLRLTMDLGGLWSPIKEKTLRETILVMPIDQDLKESLFYVILNSEPPMASPYSDYIWFAEDNKGNVHCRMVADAPAKLFKNLLLRRYWADDDTKSQEDCMVAFVNGLIKDINATSTKPISQLHSDLLVELLRAWFREGEVGLFVCQDPQAPGFDYMMKESTRENGKKYAAFASRKTKDMSDAEIDAFLLTLP